MKLFRNNSPGLWLAIGFWVVSLCAPVSAGASSRCGEQDALSACAPCLECGAGDLAAAGSCVGMACGCEPGEERNDCCPEGCDSACGRICCGMICILAQKSELVFTIVEETHDFPITAKPSLRHSEIFHPPKS